MPRNKLDDLNNHLFEQIERLNNEELSEDDLKKEISRAKAMALLAKPIVDNAKTFVDAMKLVGKGNGNVTRKHLSGIINIKDEE